jgi:hypothetical protein
MLKQAISITRPTSQQMMLRVKVSPATQGPANLPEFVAGNRQWDDFLIDEEASVA